MATAEVRRSTPRQLEGGEFLMGSDHHYPEEAPAHRVRVAPFSAWAYAEWAGTALPTEAQWEYAARGGLDGATFTWGEEQRPQGRIMANTWDGPDFQVALDRCRRMASDRLGGRR